MLSQLLWLRKHAASEDCRSEKSCEIDFISGHSKFVQGSILLCEFSRGSDPAIGKWSCGRMQLFQMLPYISQKAKFS